MDGRSVPSWFSGFDSYLQLVFFAITLVIAIYALHIYRLTGHRQSRLVSLSFFLISCSYLLWALLNLAIVRALGQFLCEGFSLCIVSALVDVAIYIHILLFLSGLVTLNYAVVRLRSRRAFALLFIIIALVILFSIRVFFFFYLLSSILLFFLMVHHFGNYLKRRKETANPLLMSVAFGLLFLASLEFILGLSRGVYYMIGNIIVLVSYLLILAGLMRVQIK